MYLKCLYMNMIAYVSGAPCNNPTSVPSRMAMLGTTIQAHTTSTLTVRQRSGFYWL